jgi:hypothetical protein
MEERFSPGTEPSSGKLLDALETTKQELKLHVTNDTIRATVHSNVLVEDLLAAWLATQWKEYTVVVSSHRGEFRAGKHVAGVVHVRP